MKLLFEVDQTKLNVTQRMRVYEDHIEIEKPDTSSSASALARTKFGIVAISDVRSVYLKKAKGWMATGLIQFQIAGAPQATLLNHYMRCDCLNFAAADNEKMERVKEYVEKAAGLA